MEYLLPSDELNSLRKELQDTQYRDANGNWRFGMTKAEIIKRIREIMLRAYWNGNRDVCDMLDIYDDGLEAIDDSDLVAESIDRKVAGKTFAERVSEYFNGGNVDDIMRIAETDSHRVYNEAETNTANTVKDKIRLVKTWVTMNDELVRETHYYLENVTVDYDDEFYTIDGDHAKAPGGFESAENNVNCRCRLEIARKADE